MTDDLETWLAGQVGIGGRPGIAISRVDGHDQRARTWLLVHTNIPGGALSSSARAG
ncbi:hypothetical protein [Nonomuraea sp. CA-141351]|uniref:hypothetical protein n=1 Tax=Nonomuraea sp. CA-141351 TaxID=3239996 RepID=UPI003D937C75